jgi:hypothetical protein
LKLQDLAVVNLLVNARFVFDIQTSRELIVSGSVFVNGYSASKVEAKLFLGDTLQLIVGMRYYIVHKWLLNWNHQASVRLSKFLSSRNNQSRSDLSKQVSRSFPD